MTDLNRILAAFAHDPLRRGDRSPIGAVPAGTMVALLLRVDGSVRSRVRDVVLEVSDLIGSSDAGATEASCEAVSMRECPEGYCAEVDTSGEPRVLFYRFVIRIDEGEILLTCRSDGLSAGGVACVIRSEGSKAAMALGFQLTIYDPDFETPSWFEGSVMYQVFPDRFARGDTGIRREGVDSHAARGWPVVLHEDWNEPPAWGESYDPIDFFGGTLDGIRRHLDYLDSLGVGVLYLNPIWEARSNHRYDTGDYEQVDPILGTWEDFDRLVEDCAERGIRVVLDTVLSHTGSASRYFNADGSYGSLGAAQGMSSPYRQWYDFASDEPGSAYRCWWNDPTLPEVEESDASWQQYMLGVGARSRDLSSVEMCDSDHGLALSGEATGGGVLGGWIGHGASGLRLDVADEIPDEVLERVRASAKGASRDAVIVGEVWEDPTTKKSYGAYRTYALGRSLDSVMNYPLRSVLLRYALGMASARELEAFLKLQRSNYPGPLYVSLMNLLSSHDVERVRSVLASGREFRELPREGQASLVAGITSDDDRRGACFQRMLATLIYVLPGVPCLYYGDERGMQGGRDPFDRATFPWHGARGDCGEDLTGLYQGLGRFRNNSEALRHGASAFYSFGNDVVCVLRVARLGSFDVEALLCIVNRSELPQRVTIDLIDAASGLSEEDAFMVRRSAHEPRCVFAARDSESAFKTFPSCEDGIFVGEMEPMQACVFQLSGSLEVPLEYGAGVICHVTSVPNEDVNGQRLGPGTLGAPSRRFVDVLADAGIRYWQILPLNPTDEYGSPYAGLSAFAGNTRLLSEDEIVTASEDEIDSFVATNDKWLLPYAVFVAIKKVLGESPWQEWPEEFREWKPDLAQHPSLAFEVRAECAKQLAFDRQWKALRRYANDRGVSIIGDMPIYMSADSADVWMQREYFALDAQGRMAAQGGVPPDQFAQDGQLWGTPTYRWDVLREHGYDWWMRRLVRMFEWYDYVRIDHFLGFSAYYCVPEGKSAREGAWEPGPGIDLFRHAYEEFGPLPVIAEDLGIVTPEVRHLLARTGFPGMDVIQFADGDPRMDWASKKGKIAFSGTHDTPTLRGWASRRYCGGDANAEGEVSRIAHELEDKLVASHADVVMFALQDVLELGDEARMNVPGTKGGNWEWQACQSDVDRHRDRLFEIASSRRDGRRPR